MDFQLSDFAANGAVRFRGALLSDLGRLEQTIAGLPTDNAGIRLRGLPALTEMLAATGCVGAIPTKILGAVAKPVRAVLFAKTALTNWSLAWHQDRTICVKAKSEVEGFGPWTVKQGMIHVAPPVGLLEKMVTIRVHLDDVSASNAPLLIAPGSHRDGMVPVGKIPTVVEHRGAQTCLAARGDVWLYSTLILHASDVAQKPKTRRVLQVDYAAFDLPGGLEWQGI